MTMKLTRAEKEWVDAYGRELRERFPTLVEEVLIYGSRARGDSTPDSDLDVLLIVRDEAAGLKREMRRLGYLLSADGGVVPSIIAYTVEEWERLGRSGSRFRRAVERDEVRVL